MSMRVMQHTATKNREFYHTENRKAGGYSTTKRLQKQAAKKKRRADDARLIRQALAGPDPF